MDDLVQFLRDRYDDEAAEAQAAEERSTTTRRFIQGEWVEFAVQPPEWRRSVWSPARVLREVDAKRQLLDLHEPGTQECVDGDVCMVCTLRGDGPYFPCDTLRLLALPYADHSDYQETWKP